MLNELLQEFHQQHPDAAKAPIRTVTYDGKRFELSSYEVAPKSTHRINMSDHPDEFFLYHKMTDLAKSPQKTSNEAAGWDIHAAETHEIPPHSRAVVGTGLAIEPPKHTYTRIAPRSGLASRGIDVGAGVVDPDYTGELKVVLINTTDFVFSVKPGARIAQIIFEYYAEGIPSNNYGPIRATRRGNKGFGSSGQ